MQTPLQFDIWFLQSYEGFDNAKNNIKLDPKSEEKETLGIQYISRKNSG